MARSVWKNFFVNNNFFELLKKKKNYYIIYNRSTFILKEFIEWLFKIYNGKRFFNLIITEKLINFRFGEFAHTRRLGKNIHIKKKIRNLKKKK